MVLGWNECPVMKLIAFLGFVIVTAALGTLRFGGGMRAVIWLDVLFICCAAATVGTAVSLILVRMHGAARGEWPGNLGTPGDPWPDRDNHSGE